MIQYLLVALGAALGGALRHGTNVVSARLWGISFPFGTLAVNIIGSLLMGGLVGYFAFKGEANQHLKLFLTTGILGGFTTFSAFSLEVALLYEKSAYGTAATYVVLSVLGSVVCVFIGIYAMRAA